MYRAVLSLAATLTLAAGEFWNDKKAEEWTPQEREQLLSHSPWAKPSGAALDMSKGAGGSSRYYGVIGKRQLGIGTDAPALQTLVRWESAAPVRAAAKNELPETASGHLVISVTMTGALAEPGSAEKDEELLHSTSLQAKGKTALNPDLVLRDPKTGMMYFVFGGRARAAAGDKEWLFETNFGTLSIKARFVEKEMMYRGKPAL
ncbi:MAG: hypothetical protein HYX27_21695 [Acidobacteria bacterium]|nr:hypothetical protein [Acidobacteriota bacterium]